MDIEIGNYVKTYDLCTGEICIGIVEHIYNKDKDIDCWRGSDEFCYKGEPFKKIKSNTAIWDRKGRRWVFKFYDPHCACFSTIIVDACPEHAVMYRLCIDGEKVKYRLP